MVQFKKNLKALRCTNKALTSTVLTISKLETFRMGLIVSNLTQNLIYDTISKISQALKSTKIIYSYILLVNIENFSAFPFR